MTPNKIKLYEWTRIDPKTNVSLKGISLEGRDLGIVNDVGKMLEISEMKDGLMIQSNSWIGILQLSNITIEVVPKISIANVMAMIEYSYDIEEISTIPNEFSFKETEWTLPDLMIFYLLKKVDTLIRAGLYKSYITHERNLRAYRGRLNIIQNIKTNKFRRDRLFCHFDELEYNNVENRIILSTLVYCMKITRSNYLQKKIAKQITIFSSIVEPLDLYRVDFKSITYHKLNEKYNEVHALCQLIINSMGIGDLKSTFHGRRAFSFFINMNQLFERFVERILKEFLVDYKIEPQKADFSVILHCDGSHCNKSIRPDIKISEKISSRLLSILDCKYKIDIDAKDLYQIFIYVLAYGLQNGIILLPSDNNNLKGDNCYKLVYQNIDTSTPIKIRVIRIDINRLLSLLKEHNENQIKNFVINDILKWGP